MSDALRLPPETEGRRACRHQTPEVPTACGDAEGQAALALALLGRSWIRSPPDRIDHNLASVPTLTRLSVVALSRTLW